MTRSDIILVELMAKGYFGQPPPPVRQKTR